MNNLALPPAIVAASLILAACGSDTDTTSAGDASDASTGLLVAAGFYPLEFLVEQVGGDRVTLSPLTPPGSEPHDIELTPQALITLTDADLVVYEAGFQPAVDDALTERDAATLDVSALATRVFDPEGSQSDADEAGLVDPHFWNDPTLYAEAAGLVADALAEADPDGAETYRANAQTLTDALLALDGDAEEALANCAIDKMVTAHDAFGYFAERYGFTPVAIAGISPEAEPSPADLAAVTDIVTADGVSTIYTETLVSPEIAETVAAETGATTAVLDPLEGITDESAGTTYLEVMKANIDTVAAGQDCG